MPEYAITFARSARPELERLEPAMVARIVARIEALGESPRPSGVRKLLGSHNLWRVRVGDYRIVYEIDDRRHIVDVVRIRHRREVYE